MKRSLAYLLFILFFYIGGGWYLIFHQTPLTNSPLEVFVYCGFCGGVGGITYCLRGIYLNACVRENWKNTWLPWYFIRPIVSFICGAASCLFLKAGLILLEAKQSDTTSNLALYALAFVAGLNVDKFIEKIEDVAETTWGIKKSRASSNFDDKDK